MKKQLKDRVPAFSGMMTLVTALAIMTVGTGSLYGEDRRKDKWVISEHQTISTYQGISYHLCAGETGRCPKCGRSGQFAIFKIEKYIESKDPKKRGIRKRTTYRIQVGDYNKNGRRRKFQ